jgi:putative glutamine amidotransferase
VDAVRKAGGVPVLLAPGEINPDQIFRLIDGLIFAGGGDINPAVYNGNHHPSIERVDNERDALEIELARQALSRQTPTLGICRGQQLLNVATGGNLIEHLPDQFGETVRHRGAAGENVEHPVQIQPGSRLAQITGVTTLSTVSKHHQGIGRITAEWQVMARAADGVIEAQEHKHHPWMIAVQWHPELSYQDARHLRLFQALVEAARNYQSKSTS